MNEFNLIGFGKMGIQITSLLMTMGYKVNIFSKNFDSKEKRFKISNKIFEKYLKIKQTGNFNVYQNIKDLPKNHTIETLTEDLEIKKKIISQLNYDFDNTLLFTNTSSYDPKEINENAFGVHFLILFINLKL